MLAAVEQQGAGDVVLPEQNENNGLFGLSSVIKGHGKSAGGRVCEAFGECIQRGHPTMPAQLSSRFRHEKDDEKECFVTVMQEPKLLSQGLHTLFDAGRKVAMAFH